jgi:hypothetical protein
VAGIPQGHYELTIDGEAMGVYDSAALATGIELEENPRTPDYKQALQVAELNKKRNEAPVRALRNEWSQMQQFYRLQRMSKANPDNADLAKNAEAQAKKVEGLEKRIAKHEEAAAEFEKQILKIVPAPHKYRVAKVDTGTVNARILLNGKPLVDGVLVFEGDKGRVLAGTTNKDGKFQVAPFGPAPVLVPGDYRVAIRGKDVPPKYSGSATSGLITEVKTGANEFAFELQE